MNRVYIYIIFFLNFACIENVEINYVLVNNYENLCK